MRLAATLLGSAILAACQGNSPSASPPPDSGPGADCTPPSDTDSPQVYSLGSRGAINDIGLSADGRRLVVAGESGVYMLCADTLADVWSLPDPVNAVLDVAFSEDGTRLVTSEYVAHRRFPESYLAWRDAATGRLQERLLTTSYPFRAMAFTGEGEQIAAGVYAYDAATSRVLLISNEAVASLTNYSGPTPTVDPATDLGTFEGEIQALGFSPDGARLAAVFADGRGLLWRVEGKRLLDQVAAQGAGGYQSSVQFSPDGSKLVIASPEAGLFVWDITPRGKLENLRTIPLLDIREIAFRPGREQVAIGAARGLLTLWDMDTATLLRTYPASDYITGLAFDRTGATLYESSLYAVHRWDVETGTLTQSREFTQGEWLYSLDFSPDGRWFATATPSGLILVWDMQTRQVERTIYTHNSVVRRAVYSPDGRWLATASFDGTAAVWDVEMGFLRCKFVEHDETLVIALAWSPDGQRIATGGHDGSLFIWNADTCQPEETLAGHPEMVIDLAFSPDGGRLASGSWDGMAAIWDAATGERLDTLDAQTRAVESVAWSPDGSRLALGRGAFYLDGSSPVWLWDMISGTVARDLEWPTETPYYWLRAVRWSADGTLIAAAGGPQIYVWEAWSGRLVATLSGHRGEIWGLDWSPDGHYLASGAIDGSLLLWDVSEIGLPGGGDG